MHLGATPPPRKMCSPSAMLRCLIAQVFRTDAKQVEAQGKDDYFMSSADKIRFFLEEGALDATGSLCAGLSKHEALNKAGHALHELHPVFKRYAQSSKLRQLVQTLGWASADLVQSMYIFKQPKIGGVVTSHQDSTFLRTEPLSCLGLWLALQPASESNGCLWARPGSHKEQLRRHFCRHPTPDGEGAQVDLIMEFVGRGVRSGDVHCPGPVGPASMQCVFTAAEWLLFVEHAGNVMKFDRLVDDVKWEGSLPSDPASLVSTISLSCNPAR